MGGLRLRADVTNSNAAQSAAVVSSPGPAAPAPGLLRRTARPSAATDPGDPTEPPTVSTLLAFTRREVRRTVSPQALATPAVVVAPGVVVPPELADDVTVTGPPSFSDRLTVFGLGILHQISNVIGIEIAFQLSALLSSQDPPFFTTFGVNATKSQYTFTDAQGDDQSWKVWEIAPPNPSGEYAPPNPSGEYVVAIHGGGFILQPNMMQWSDYASMARDTGATVIVPMYPLVTPAAGGTAATIVPTMAEFVAGQVAAHGADNVSVYADSAGGLITMVTLQKIIRDCNGDAACLAAGVPSRIVLLSPPLGGTTIFTDPNVVLVDDPVSAIPKPGDPPDWQGDLAADDPLWNPMAGSASGLPPTAIYLGTRDILTPGALLFAQRMVTQDPDGDLSVIIGDGQIHDWALGGVYTNSQAPLYRDDIYRHLGISS
jgi:triacylglycerol lipase